MGIDKPTMEGIVINSLAAAGTALSLLTGINPPWYDPNFTPPPDKVTVQVVTVNGSGCPKDTVQVAVSPDNTAFTVTYSAYTATVGPDSKPTDARKNCQAALQVNVPNGFSYGIVKVDYRGYAQLAKGATALLKSGYYFQGNSSTDTREHPYNGELSDNWTATDSTEWAQIVWSPCTEVRNFNINTELRANKGTSAKTDTSYITMDSLDADFQTKYHFAWKPCPAKS
jgi:hypothetical protein